MTFYILMSTVTNQIKATLTIMPSLHSSLQVKKTMEATLQTIQDMVTIEDYDVTDCFHHSNSMESVKSTVSESFMSKPSIAKRRANQQETEQFYFTVNERRRWWMDRGWKIGTFSARYSLMSFLLSRRRLIKGSCTEDAN